jgi:SAM-dependent methyltransferase
VTGQANAVMAPPSDWVVRWSDLARPGTKVLDVACGGGRHALFFAARGHPVVAVDRDPEAGRRLAGVEGVLFERADLETGCWSASGRQFGVVVVTNYLHRPLFPALLDAVAHDGLLIYETFAAGNERYGRPTNPDFLLVPGELLEQVRGSFRVLGYEDLDITSPKPAAVQRVCARRA